MNILVIKWYWLRARSPMSFTHSQGPLQTHGHGPWLQCNVAVRVKFHEDYWAPRPKNDLAQSKGTKNPKNAKPMFFLPSRRVFSNPSFIDFGQLPTIYDMVHQIGNRLCKPIFYSIVWLMDDFMSNDSGGFGINCSILQYKSNHVFMK